MVWSTAGAVAGDRARPTPFPGFAERLAAIRARIEAAAPDPAAVTLVAVTKGFGPEAVRTALAAGLTAVGENYADELVAKAAALADDPGPGARVALPRGRPAQQGGPAGARWSSCWQGVARSGEGRAIARRRPGARVLVQVDVAGLPGRGGVPAGRGGRAWWPRCGTRTSTWPA